MIASSEPFPRSACGLCCQKVNLSEQTIYLDRGDGTCRHFDDSTRLCTIYETRPLVCRVEDYYHHYLSEQMSWQDFIQINIEVCKQFQSE
ncbi:TPA: YkgJ family cysteine cluster protein [Neisseria meningitidis]